MYSSFEGGKLPRFVSFAKENWFDLAESIVYKGFVWNYLKLCYRRSTGFKTRSAKMVRIRPKGPDTAKMVPIRPKWSGYGQNGPDTAKMVRIRPKWSGYGQNGPGTAKMVRIRPKWYGYGQNGPDTAKMVRLRPKWCGYGQNGPDTAKMKDDAKQITSFFSL